jgi:peptide/nickel transport system permease protein
MIRWYAPARRRLTEQPVAIAGLLWLALASLLSLLAPLLAPAGPFAADTSRQFLPPGVGQPLGTDLLGRDMASRVVWGGRWTLAMGGLSLALTVGIGLPAGLAAGLLGGWTDAVAMRTIDALLAFPGLLLAMAAVAVLGPGLWPVSVAVGLSAAPAFARVARAAAQEVAIQPYVDASRSLGSSQMRILLRHILPNSAAALLSFAAIQLGWVLLNGAALSFLGLGAPPGSPEWGAMLAEGRAFLRDAPWISLFPGLALSATVLAANVVGDAILETVRHA